MFTKSPIPLRYIYICIRLYSSIWGYKAYLRLKRLIGFRVRYPGHPVPRKEYSWIHPTDGIEGTFNVGFGFRV